MASENVLYRAIPRDSSEAYKRLKSFIAEHVESECAPSQHGKRGVSKDVALADLEMAHWLVFAYVENVRTKTERHLRGVAMLTVQDNANTGMYVSLICSRHKQGYRLMEHVKQLAASLGISKVSLGAIPDAVEAYKRWGFSSFEDACGDDYMDDYGQTPMSICVGGTMAPERMQE